MGKDDTTFTEELKTLGRTTQLTSSLSLHKHHMDEVITVMLDNKKETGDDIKKAWQYTSGSIQF